jgi:hypothetical protein
MIKLTRGCTSKRRNDAKSRPGNEAHNFGQGGLGLLSVWINVKAMRGHNQFTRQPTTQAPAVHQQGHA